ncbi:Cyanovirin-N [Aspergillus steynii IBT 23096]|uniref:Cyanovirin-N n=1 Tax=Aspergillus steynii IBT 23096 TaxID=1392250 RepID=A0A2I2FX81_9EURO|nr:Cyanovirin-N [Aspergillus steynii IBT 23096]PLB45250.1 Cyanovirin-N [Aspergillus steynii IBT 23096]
MSFHHSAEDIQIEDNHILVAKLANEDGEMQDASIDLDEFIGNNDGSFEWDGQNFSETAEDVEFSIEGDGEVPVLRAKLNNAEGEQVEADINLGERVVNNNGAFEFQ